MNIQPRLKKAVFLKILKKSAKANIHNVHSQIQNVQEITLKHLLLATVGFWAILSNGLDKTEVTNEGNFIE